LGNGRPPWLCGWEMGRMGWPRVSCGPRARVAGVQRRAVSSIVRCLTIQAADRARQAMDHRALPSPASGVTPAWAASAALSLMA
jgi:hypothetical protein